MHYARSRYGLARTGICDILAYTNYIEPDLAIFLPLALVLPFHIRFLSGRMQSVTAGRLAGVSTCSQLRLPIAKRTVATIASFKIPKVNNEPNVRILGKVFLRATSDMK